MAIQPEDMRDHLERQAGGAGPAEAEAAGTAAPPQPGPPLGDAALEALLRSIAASYFSLRIGLALLAFAMPILLWWLAGGLLPSISDYYHAEPLRSGLLGRAPRDVFVGVLCAVGAFLWLYKGYRTRENVALNFAGLAAVAIALFPTDQGDADTLVGKIHGVAAVSYFLAIAYVCLFQAKATLPLVRDEALRRTFGNAYRLLGAAMVLLPLAVVLIYSVGTLEARFGGIVYWLELVAIYVFAGFWLVKSLEIRTIQRQPPG